MRRKPTDRQSENRTPDRRPSSIRKSNNPTLPFGSRQHTGLVTPGRIRGHVAYGTTTRSELDAIAAARAGFLRAACGVGGRTPAEALRLWGRLMALSREAVRTRMSPEAFSLRAAVLR